MSQSSKGKLNFRCPSCFMRDIDMDMFYDADREQYYCLRCAFRGSLDDVVRLNEQAKFRYGAMRLRVTDFGEDNDPVRFAPHKRGEQ